MALVLLLLSMIASTPTTATVTPNSHSATSSPQASKDAIQGAQEVHNRVFTGYVLLLFLTVVGTYWVWSSGNKAQDAVQADANARILEAEAVAAKAQGEASIAKQKTQEIERDNLTLRGNVATLETQAANAQKDVSALQKAATDAKTAQQKVEIELAKQQEIAATAERNLLLLKEQMKDRTIPDLQADAMVIKLDEMFNKGFPRGKVLIKWATSTPDAWPLVLRLKEIFKAAGWTDVSDVAALAMTGEGFFIGMRDRRNPPKCEAAVWQAFNASGIPFTGYDDPSAPEDGVSIVIGQKPPLH